MVHRFPSSRVLLAASAIFAATPVVAAPALATHPATTFFSSLSEEPLARLEAAAIAPRYVRHGPFRVPAPGVEIESPTLAIHDQPCTPDDWARLLKELSAWRQLPGASDFLLTLPDGRIFVFLRAPSIGDKIFSGLVRPLVAAGAKTPPPLLLRIAHDGAERLRIDLHPLPSPRARAAENNPADAPPSSDAPDEAAPAVAPDTEPARAPGPDIAPAPAPSPAPPPASAETASPSSASAPPIM
jgi:hypothetical protein